MVGGGHRSGNRDVWRVYRHYLVSLWAVTPPGPAEHDDLLDRFMPAYEVVERHHVHVAAPAALALSVAGSMDLQPSPLVRAHHRGT
jgi:hypothetical protein